MIDHVRDLLQLRKGKTECTQTKFHAIRDQSFVFWKVLPSPKRRSTDRRKSEVRLCAIQTFSFFFCILFDMLGSLDENSTVKTLKTDIVSYMRTLVCLLLMNFHHQAWVCERWLNHRVRVKLKHTTSDSLKDIWKTLVLSGWNCFFEKNPDVLASRAPASSWCESLTSHTSNFRHSNIVQQQQHSENKKTIACTILSNVNVVKTQRTYRSHREREKLSWVSRQAGEAGTQLSCEERRHVMDTMRWWLKTGSSSAHRTGNVYK